MIHAPRAAVYARFHRLILLAPGGRCCHSGGAGEAALHTAFEQATVPFAPDGGSRAAAATSTAEFLLDAITPVRRCRLTPPSG